MGLFLGGACQHRLVKAYTNHNAAVLHLMRCSARALLLVRSGTGAAGQAPARQLAATAASQAKAHQDMQDPSQTSDSYRPAGSPEPPSPDMDGAERSVKPGVNTPKSAGHFASELKHVSHSGLQGS